MIRHRHNLKPCKRKDTLKILSPLKTLTTARIPRDPATVSGLMLGASHYYCTVKFILHLVQTFFFKPCLCSTVVFPLDSCRDNCQHNHLWSYLNTIHVTQSYPRWRLSCPRQLCPTCCHFCSSSATCGSPDCHLCCCHLHHHTQT